ncbi:polysaccharide pyruvyl transferase family protein [Nocardioides jiangxiensis]|uniref:Polysaccharide pyruvyl transferase family protein n=1 Tax=Nocardioides jiangxiensis TaxID=3064524 RepID=A0ABT9AXI3_9ACTN|nr:polysaccharide pyruvyl transferase family protein [Nocardioides sp. WY-20]MDO7866978.1 polysaccharide pyruvyl transferase family protein [Nocardioides sp. WY-20]
MRERDRSTLEELRSRTLDVLVDVIGRGATVALLDAPNQRNVGDSMIWAGEVAYFRRLGLKVVYVADLQSYDTDVLRRTLPADGVILLHGGGNVGDLWRGHQKHREQVARDFRDRKIVQLPQSVWFSEEKYAANANRILGAHPDFTLLVRDRETEERAAAWLPDVPRRYCWDMALGWDPRPSRKQHGGAPALVVARTDHEGASGLGTADLASDLGVAADVRDWTSPELDTLGWRLARAVPRIARRWPALRRWHLFQVLLRASFGWINRANVRSGVRLYAGRRVVVVDRLHAHVLAVLMGIDHVMLDNSYRKLGAVFDDYTHRFSTAAYAHDRTEAIDLARTILNRPEN